MRQIADYEWANSYYDSPNGMGVPNSYGPHSRHVLVLASAHSKAFLGLSYVGKGSRILRQLKDAYGGLGDYISGTARTENTPEARASATAH